MVPCFSTYLLTKDLLTSLWNAGYDEYQYFEGDTVKVLLWMNSLPWV